MNGTLYRAYDTEDRLLYVGCSTNIKQRLQTHAAKAPWWPQVRNIRMEHFEDSGAAFRAEGRAIRGEHPIHNQVRGIFRGIIDDIRDNIAAGVLRRGDILPSTARLAETYGCSKATVRWAIDILRDGGDLIGSPGRGLYVRGRDG